MLLYFYHSKIHNFFKSTILLIIHSICYFSVYTVPAGNDWMKDVDDRVQFGVRFGKARGFIKTGDTIVVVTGWKQGSGFTNTMRIVYVFERKKIK